jgi:aminoglycoside phosphotransferase (APT) family kinase protein
VEQRIATYLAHRMPQATDIAVNDLARIYAGSSQETFRFHACWCESGSTQDQWLILRREPPAGLVVAARDLEYRVYTALAKSGIPIPKAYFLELDPRWLDRPFFIMEYCPGKAASVVAPGNPYGEVSSAIGRQFWQHLGTLAAVDPNGVGLQDLRGGRDEGACWGRELDYWEAILDAGEQVIDPAARGAIRWLRRNPPPPPDKPAIVHGDYRTGNFLFTPDGQLSGILDWEMCHIGDPLEDIAWALNEYWPMSRYFPLEEGLALWEQTSGLKIEPAALEWWRLFTPVKASGIWTTAMASFRSGDSKEMIVAMSGWNTGHFHRDEIIRRMTERRGMG